MKKSRLETFRRIFRARFTSKPEDLSLQLSSAQMNILAGLAKDGIVVLPGMYDEAFCSAVRQSIDDYISVRAADIAGVQQKVSSSKEYKMGVPYPDGTKFWVDKNGSDIRIIHSEKITGLISQFHMSDFFYDIGSALLKRKMTRNFTMANRTTFIPGNLGSGGGWHRDNNYDHGFKALVYLSDVNENNGPFEYIRKSFSISNHLLDFPYPDKYQFTHDQIDAYLKKRPDLHCVVNGKAGTVVVFNVNGIHRGRPVKAGCRYAVTNYYK